MSVAFGDKTVQHIRVVARRKTAFSDSLIIIRRLRFTLKQKEAAFSGPPLLFAQKPFSNISLSYIVQNILFYKFSRLFYILPAHSFLTKHLNTFGRNLR